MRTDDDNDDDSLGEDAVAPIVTSYSWRVLLFAPLRSMLLLSHNYSLIID